MKRLAAMMAGILLFMATGTASATYITLSNPELLTATALSNTNEPWNGLFRVSDYGPVGVMFLQNMSRPLEPTAAPYYVYSYIGVDSFEMRLANVNNSPWELALYVQADGVTYLSDYQVVPNQITPIDFEQYSFDLSLLGDAISDVEYLGFAVRSLLDGDPSNPDAYRVMAAPVPEPGTLLLLGMGVFCLAIYGKRRRNG